MLVFGDLAWVPFFYSSQALYVVSARPEVPWFLIAVSLALHVLGYVIFRQSNLQKNLFRNAPNDPRVKGEYMCFSYVLSLCSESFLKL